MTRQRMDWTRGQLILAFNLYCRLPFGQMHSRNPRIIELAGALGRTPGSVAMKLVNFASLDPMHARRNVKGLKNASAADRQVWDEFHGDWEALASESQEAFERLMPGANAAGEAAPGISAPSGPTEMTRTVRVRRVQAFFRQTVLLIYGSRCSICDLSLPELLVASHIIPWVQSVPRRADPTNGLALCSIHDKAFDRGLISATADYLVLVSNRARVAKPASLHQVALLDIEGRPLRMPERFRPDPSALEYHRREIFQGDTR